MPDPVTVDALVSYAGKLSPAAIFGLIAFKLYLDSRRAKNGQSREDRISRPIVEAIKDQTLIFSEKFGEVENELSAHRGATERERRDL